MKKCVFPLIAIVILMVMGACGQIAPPLALPAQDKIESMKIQTISGEEFFVTDETTMTKIFSILSAAKPTSFPSVQDAPQLPYGTINLVYSGKILTLFYYDNHSRHLLEQPYQGIYECESDVESVLNTLID